MIKRLALVNLQVSHLVTTGMEFIMVRWFELLRIGIIFGVFIGAVLLGALAVKFNPVYVLIASGILIILAALEIILRHFNLTPLIILITAAFIPLSLPTGTESRLVLSLVFTTVFVAFWVLRMLSIERRVWLYPSPVNFPLLGFMLVTVIALVWSNVFRDPSVVTWRSFPFVQIASTLVMVMLPAALLLFANNVKDVRMLKIMTGVVIIAGMLGLIRNYGGVNIPVDISGLFSMWAIALCTGMVLFNRRLPPWIQGILIVVTLAWVYWGFFLNVTWLAGWLPGFIAIGILFFKRSKKLTVIAGLLVVLFVALNTHYLEMVFSAERQVSGVTRLAAWAVNWKITSQHLLFGTGPAGYAAYYMSYFPTNAMATHSNYIDILAETGIVGFVLCLWFIISLTWLGWKLTIRLKGKGDFREALANAVLAGTIGGFVMMAFGDWLFPFAYTQTIAGFNYAVYSWLFMGMILILDRLTPSEAGAV